MSGELLERYTSRIGALSEREGDSDGTEDLGSFGWLRGQRDRAIMLELRKRTGDILAIGYGFIDRIALDPTTGISLHTGKQMILIKGRNLNGEARPQVRLFQGLTRCRVPWIAEADQSVRMQVHRLAVVVEAIEW